MHAIKYCKVHLCVDVSIPHLTGMFFKVTLLVAQVTDWQSRKRMQNVRAPGRANIVGLVIDFDALVIGHLGGFRG